MTEAPERIWATINGSRVSTYSPPFLIGGWESRSRKIEREVEYVRAGLYAKLEAKLAASEARVKELTEACEQLRMDAWGYDYRFESGFHAHVFETLDYLIQPTPKREQP